MIHDLRTQFCDADAVNASGTAAIGDQVDLLGTPNGDGGVTFALDIANGQPVYLVFLATTGIVAAGAGTLTLQLVSADDAALTTNPTVHFQTAAFVTQATTPASGLAAGDILGIFVLPLEGNQYRRYLGVRGVVATMNVSAGAIDAFLTLDPPKWQALPASTGSVS